MDRDQAINDLVKHGETPEIARLAVDTALEHGVAYLADGTTIEAR